MNWVHFWPAGCLLCLPWVWLTFHVRSSGGFSIDIEKPPIESQSESGFNWLSGGPELIGDIVFYPRYMAVMGWTCPKTPEEWQRQIKRWWMDLRGKW